MLNFILQAQSGVVNAAVNMADSTHSGMVTGIQTNSQEITETKISLIQMIMKGGPIMVPLAILLIVSIYILIERLLVIGKASKKTSNC